MQQKESRSPLVTQAPVDPRREKRLHVAVPIKVFLDAGTANFQLCCTYEISMVGARLVAVSGITQIGQTIWLQRHNKRARYKVVWIGKAGTTQADQIGVEAFDTTSMIWENELRLRMMQP